MQKQTTSLLSALFQFRNEIQGLNLSTSKKVRLMENFKDAYKRSEDYDIAMETIYPFLERMAEKDAETKKSFQNYWKGIKKFDKGIFDFLTNAWEPVRVRAKELLEQGMSEKELVLGIAHDAETSLGRTLSQKEMDKIRYIVLEQKLRLAKTCKTE